eukprot:Rmarinus@m.18006
MEPSFGDFGHAFHHSYAWKKHATRPKVPYSPRVHVQHHSEKKGLLRARYERGTHEHSFDNLCPKPPRGVSSMDRPPPLRQNRRLFSRDFGISPLQRRRATQITLSEAMGLQQPTLSSRSPPHTTDSRCGARTVSLEGRSSSLYSLARRPHTEDGSHTHNYPPKRNLRPQPRASRQRPALDFDMTSDDATHDGRRSLPDPWRTSPDDVAQPSPIMGNQGGLRSEGMRRTMPNRGDSGVPLANQGQMQDRSDLNVGRDGSSDAEKKNGAIPNHGFSESGSKRPDSIGQRAGGGVSANGAVGYDGSCSIDMGGDGMSTACDVVSGDGDGGDGRDVSGGGGGDDGDGRDVSGGGGGDDGDGRDV